MLYEGITMSQITITINTDSQAFQKNFFEYDVSRIIKRLKHDNNCEYLCPKLQSL